MKRFVQVTDDVTAERFGCEQKYFDRYIKAKPLRVEFASIGSITIRDEQDEAWRIMRGDYIELTSKEVANV